MRTDSMPKTVDRVLVLGLDGATWSVLDPMRQRGLMPNLQAFLARAASGTLRSIIPPVTTAAWTTMMTGCGPARHGDGIRHLCRLQGCGAHAGPSAGAARGRKERSR